MGNDKTEMLLRTLGAADAFALLAVGFSFPTKELAGALVDGRFASDVEGSLLDTGATADEASRIIDNLREATAGASADELYEALRVDYSALYYGLGRFRVMSPYESVFKKLAVNPGARATAFLTKTTHNVEDAMRKRSALPEDYRREPADHFATELDFVRHLFTGVAAAIAEDDGSQAAEWREDLQCFASMHVEPWIPSLLERTAEAAQHPVYRALANFGLYAIDLLLQPMKVDDR
ncbi:TorD/DmsD family molecular chaperone [Slackia heliotrinireducens]|uniref:TorD/DmsD family molecular chaperone n=1 Tax=Slackia heliotrinireducens TaxID=84110 RepID=UPI0033144FAD